MRVKFNCTRCCRSRRIPGLCGICRTHLKAKEQKAEREANPQEVEFGTFVGEFMWQAIFGVRQ